MAPKKRKANPSSDGSLLEGDHIHTPQVKRRKKPAIQYDPLEFCQELYDTIRNHKTEDGRLLCEPFIRVPKRRTDPEYYDVVTAPIDLLRIQHKLKSEEYEEIDQLTSDIELMVSNAKAFYKTTSQEYQDACDLWDLYMDTKNILIAEAFGDVTETESHAADTIRESSYEKEDANMIKKVVQAKKNDIDTGRPSRPTRRAARRQTGTPRLSAICAALPYEEDEESHSDLNSVHDAESSHTMEFEEDSAAEGSVSYVETEEDSPQASLYNAVKFAKNALGLIISEPFMRLPSKRIYPDYYDEIKKPLSLLNVQKKLKLGQYRDITKLATDLEIVFENAKQYNMDESQLYQDAVFLQKVMRQKYKEVTGTEFDTSALPTPIIKSRRPVEPPPPEEKKTPKRKSLTPEDILKKRLNILYKTVYEYQVEGRNLIDIFMVLPSKKDYPDYYQVISEPVDMTMIDAKIKAEKYPNDHALVADLELMFNNARHYNEEDSQVYRDADTLERLLKRKLSQLVPLGDSPRSSKTPRSKPKTKGGLSPLAQKLTDLYNAIKDYTDSRGRTLSTPFIKLPLKTEYPDYYEVIRKPIDMQKVWQRMMAKQYESVEDMVSDFVLIFDNACKYNEPDSLIYKDSLTLQRICLERKQELCADDDTNEVPDVKALLQELMMNLFIETYNHTDEDGRCYSDSFQDLPVLSTAVEEQNEEQPRKRTPSFEQVKKNLDKGRYCRVDRFQEDMFEVFEHARKVSRTDSQLYEDSVELQMFFIKKRDEICKNGEILLTPALSYMERHLQATIELEKKEKLPKEQREDEEKRKQQEEEAKEREDHVQHQLQEAAAALEPKVDADAVEHKNQTYNIGDCVYVEPREKVLEPHIVCIEKMWHDEVGDQFLRGNFYLRPQETYHVATKKFLEKEVFKSDLYEDAPFTRVLGKCYVMFVKDYFKMRPDGIPDKDVFVCESRYNTRHRAFKKIKNWQAPGIQTIVMREQPLIPVRVASVFAEKTPVEVAYDDSDEPLTLEKDMEVVEVERDADHDDGCTYYEQYKTPAGWFKLGDCVYVRSDEDRPYIAMIEKMWTDSSGNAFFHGPWSVHPTDVEHSPTRLFFKREVFRSATEDTNPMLSIQGRCGVLLHKDYCTSRPTEIPEQDIYICESKYIEAEKAIRKLAKTVKVPKPLVSPKVLDDEIYFFKKPIIPAKEPSPLLLKASEETLVEEEEDETARVESNTTANFSYREELSLDSIPDITPKEKKKKSSKPWQPSGYLVFSAESRKQVQEEHPDMTFGDISKVVGQKWRELAKEDKVRYEEKAKKLAEEHAAKQEAAEKAFNDSLAMYPPASSPADPNRMSPATSGRPLTPGQPFQPGQKGREHGYQQGFHPQTPGTQGNLPQAQAAPPPRPPSPMFVSVPPRTQRLLHSESYLRYIEGLGKDDNSVGSWERSMTASPENTPTDRSQKLPVSWLGQGVGHHDSAANALWALRDLMMKDTLTISRTLEFSQL